MNEKILLVDDEKEIADLMEVYLTNDGYAVYKFYNGTDALKCIAEVECDLAIYYAHCQGCRQRQDNGAYNGRR